jgi:hypothetical protein
MITIPNKAKNTVNLTTILNTLEFVYTECPRRQMKSLLCHRRIIGRDLLHLRGIFLLPSRRRDRHGYFVKSRWRFLDRKKIETQNGAENPVRSSISYVSIQGSAPDTRNLYDTNRLFETA